MPYLWSERIEEGSDEAEWCVAPITAEGYDLSEDSPHRDPSCGAPAHEVVLRSLSGGGWAVLGAPLSFRVSGVLTAGFRVLADRDEIQLPAGGRRFYFSSERLPQAVPFPGASEPVLCPRCRQPIQAVTTAVRCPSCGVWHHEEPDLNCWSYAESCATCGGPTALDAGFRWTPCEL